MDILQNVIGIVVLVLIVAVFVIMFICLFKEDSIKTKRLRKLKQNDYDSYLNYLKTEQYLKVCFKDLFSKGDND